MEQMNTPYELRIKGIEAGAASMFIELSQGKITVKHGTDGTTLKEIHEAKPGAWDKIWEAINNA